MKAVLQKLKPYLRWAILGGTLFFIAKTLKDHWQEVVAIPVTAATWAGLIVALGVTLLAHIWSGWVWHWILQELALPIKGLWSTTVYLKTNIAKYLPGNVWHFYGRVRALQTAGASLDRAILGVLLEPLLMAAGALTLGVLCSWQLRGAPLVGLLIALVGVHPRILNPVLRRLAKAKAKAQGLANIDETIQLQRYPLKPFLGELAFVLLRSLGFLLTLLALGPLYPSQITVALGGFGLAWLMGLVVPGAPGGIGVFEAVAIAILAPHLPIGQLVSAIAFYRLLSTLAEVLGAGLIWLDHPSRAIALPPAPAIIGALPYAVEPELSPNLELEETNPDPLEDTDENSHPHP